jgi:PPIC-type PPIASE domain
MVEEENAAASGFFDPSAVSTLRAMVLCASGALIGLGIAGYGLFTAAGTITRTVPPENVAMVNQRPILRSDFITQVESEIGKKFDATTRDEQLRVLDEMVREELLVQRALELDFAETDQGARTALVSAISDQTIAEATTSQATEAQLRDYFQKHSGQWATEGVMTLRHFVLLKSPARDESDMMAEAQSAVAQARHAASPIEQVMKGHNFIEQEAQDEQYYFAIKYRLGEALFAAVSQLSDGEISAPLAQKDGLHVVEVVKNTRPIPLSFDAARSQVLSDYNDAAQAHLMDSTLKFLRGRAKIRIGSDYASDYKP